MYCAIDRYPVFLTSAQYERLFAEAGKDKGWEWRISARICMEGKCEAHNAVYALLQEHCRQDRQAFIEQWVQFDFRDAEAQDVIDYVLEAYCDWYGHSTVCFKRWKNAETAALRAGWSPEPSGCVFELRHTVKPRRWWWRFRYGMKDRDIVLNIGANRVRRIVGTVADFYVVYGELQIRFAEDIEIGCYLPDLRPVAAVQD